MKHLFFILTLLILAGCENSPSAVSEPSSSEKVPSWEDKFQEWIKNPKPYGGLDTLYKIKEARSSGATEVRLNYHEIYDITPLAGLKDVERLELGGNFITDVSPLAELKKLDSLWISENPLSVSQINKLKEMQRGADGKIKMFINFPR